MARELGVHRKYAMALKKEIDAWAENKGDFSLNSTTDSCAAV